MPRKLRLILSMVLVVFLASMTISASFSWNGPLAQMSMPTDTPQPSPAQALGTPTSAEVNPVLPSPTWTSIFTGYTPYPETTSAYYPMGGSSSGMGCPGMSGGSMGSGASGMGTGSMGGSMGMGATSGITGTLDTEGCPMMGSMGGMGGSSSMSGMNMENDYLIAGMDMSATGSYVHDTSYSVLDNPWLLIGWVLLGVIIIAILVAMVVGILWLIRRSANTQAT